MSETVKPQRSRGRGRGRRQLTREQRDRDVLDCLEKASQHLGHALHVVGIQSGSRNIQVHLAFLKVTEALRLLGSTKDLPLPEDA